MNGIYIFSPEYWRNFFRSKEKARLFENFVSLSVLQGLNYILPLITFPYLVKVLGPEKFGLISFAQAFIGYFQILTDYGFNLSATRDISIHRDNRRMVQEIFSSVMIIKFLLFLLSFLILSILLIFIPRFREDWIVYIFTFGVVLGNNVLFPIWFFQGVEQMRYITILHLVAKIISTASIFVFIREMSDYLYVPLISSAGSLVAGFLSLRIIWKIFGVKFVFHSFRAIERQLKEGWHIFISTVAISLYTTSNTFLLGLFTNNTIVGYYSAAEKIVKATLSLLSPISQTIYPYTSKLANDSKEKAINFLKKILKIVGSVTFLISLLLFVFAVPLVNMVLGKQYQESIKVLRILAFLPFIIGLSNVFAVQGLYAFGYQHVVSKFVVFISLIHLLVFSTLTYFFTLVGSSVSVVITEILITFFSAKNYLRLIIKGA